MKYISNLYVMIKNFKMQTARHEYIAIELLLLNGNQTWGSFSIRCFVPIIHFLVTGSSPSGAVVSQLYVFPRDMCFSEHISHWLRDTG